MRVFNGKDSSLMHDYIMISEHVAYYWQKTLDQMKDDERLITEEQNNFKTNIERLFASPLEARGPNWNFMKFYLHVIPHMYAADDVPNVRRDYQAVVVAGRDEDGVAYLKYRTFRLFTSAGVRKHNTNFEHNPLTQPYYLKGDARAYIRQWDIKQSKMKLKLFPDKYVSL